MTQSEAAKSIVDTHRHPWGPKMQAKMEEQGLFDPKQGFPQTNALDLMGYREVFDLDYAMPIQREGGITLSLMTNGGEVAWLAHDLLKVSTVDGLKYLNDEYVDIMGRYPGEFVPTANAHALEEACRPVVEEMVHQGGAKAIAVASSYGDGADRVFLDSPKAEWLWEFAEANDIVVHIHPPMQSIGHESLMQYRLNEAVGRPFDSTVNGARMIASGVFDRYPKLQALIVHMGGGLASIVGRLEFCWHLNYDGIKNPPAGRPYLNKRSPFDYFKTNILVDTMGFNAIGVRAAIELCGVDRVVFGSDFGPVPYGIKEQVQSVHEVLPSRADRDRVLWETSDRIFRLGLIGPDRTLVDRTTADRTTADRTTADRTTADRTTADRTTADRTTADRTTADRQPVLAAEQAPPSERAPASNECRPLKRAALADRCAENPCSIASYSLSTTMIRA